MKPWLFGMLLLATPLCFAQVKYQDLTKGMISGTLDDDHSRQNDPFVLCTQGVKNTPRAWKPINPKLAPTPFASWTFLGNYCPIPWPEDWGECPLNYVYPYPSFDAWSNADYDAYLNWAKICNDGGDKNDWTGSGQPEDTPTSH